MNISTFNIKYSSIIPLPTNLSQLPASILFSMSYIGAQWIQYFYAIHSTLLRKEPSIGFHLL